jgi:hypothetical protein
MSVGLAAAILAADEAPTGAGLAIVGIILLAFFAVVVLVLVLIVRAVLRWRRRG